MFAVAKKAPVFIAAGWPQGWLKKKLRENLYPDQNFHASTKCRVSRVITDGFEDKIQVLEFFFQILQRLPTLKPIYKFNFKTHSRFTGPASHQNTLDARRNAIHFSFKHSLEALPTKRRLQLFTILICGADRRWCHLEKRYETESLWIIIT